ncbi:hypothetical protein BX616_010239 [Lobosporangium transversale]|nr:hypothetical protein BX616_010239 [Lobosporangium transversale]
MERRLFPDSSALRHITNRHSKDALVDMALRWIHIHPITRPHRQPEKELYVDEESYEKREMEDHEYKAQVEKRYWWIKENGNRNTVVDRMLRVDWRTGLNSTQVADLDLAYYSQHANLKNWRTLRMNYGDETTLRKRWLDPSKIERTLSHHLAPFLKHHVQVLQDKEKVWIRLSIHDGLAPHTLPPPTAVIYLIWFINSKYLLCGTFKAEWRDFVMQAILRLFKAAEIEEWPLASKSPTSLQELLLHKDSQGPHSRYRLGQLDNNPLANIPKKRRLEDRYTNGLRDICTEDPTKIIARDRSIVSDFGPNAQPSLHRVDLQLNLPYTNKSKDFGLGRSTKLPFPIKVVLEGGNVIEGIKSLIPLGVAQNPIPKFLAELHSMASNRLTINMDEEGESLQQISPG